ncbi:MAG: hypothetical protein JOZ96_16840 [Acidobacteria bacterium]|nr:hypothetical protein [Acidobacteriota bacterium]
MRGIKGETYLLLGGAGMVGQQIAQEIARELEPRQIVISGLSTEEVDGAVGRLRRDFPDVLFTGAPGDIFVRSEWNPPRRERPLSRAELLAGGEYRAALYEDLFLNLDGAYERSELVRLILDHPPHVVIDSINTATAFSYQDVYAASDLAKRQFDELEAAANGGTEELGGLLGAAGSALETVLVSQSVPQLVRHVLLINRAMRQVNTRLYLKVGTTGTGGMGLNIPYTHSEDSPSATLMEKTAIAFAHTGLLYLMARTLGGPAVKEFKPAAMIGYSDIGFRRLRVKGKGKVGVPGQNLKLYTSRTEPLDLGGSLRLRPGGEADAYEALGDLELAVVNTGENGLFTKGEFQAITYMGQMEFITPEEIARQVVLEVKGSSTGYDVIGAIDGVSMNPSYRAGYLRHLAIQELEKLEREREIPSVALGDLGPPELGKLLWEAYLLRLVCDDKLSEVVRRPGAQLAEETYALLQRDERLRNSIVSVGFPILTPDGRSLIRGPYIRIPEVKNETTAQVAGPEQVEAWAAKGWVDLRPQNMEHWRRRFETMGHATERIRERGSAAFTRDAYVSEQIHIGSVVGWIFNNEDNFGYRIK